MRVERSGYVLPHTAPMILVVLPASKLSTSTPDTAPMILLVLPPTAQTEEQGTLTIFQQLQEVGDGRLQEVGEVLGADDGL